MGKIKAFLLRLWPDWLGHHKCHKEKVFLEAVFEMSKFMSGIITEENKRLRQENLGLYKRIIELEQRKKK